MRGSVLSPKSEEELKALLRRFCSDPIWWKEEGNGCRLVKTFKSKTFRGETTHSALAYRFDCELVACGTQTRLDYRVRPSLATLILLVLLPLTLAAGLLQFLKPGGGSPTFCLAGGIANLLFFLCYFYIGRSFAKELEDLVQQT